jgi:hypothetical protein
MFDVPTTSTNAMQCGPKIVGFCNKIRRAPENGRDRDKLEPSSADQKCKISNKVCKISSNNGKNGAVGEGSDGRSEQPLAKDLGSTMEPCLQTNIKRTKTMKTMNNHQNHECWLRELTKAKRRTRKTIKNMKHMKKVKT